MIYSDFIAHNKKVFLEKNPNRNVHTIPKLQKVVVCVGVGSINTRKGVKDFSEIEKSILMITGQKPVLILSRKNISNFKLRAGMPSMLKVTLRKDKAYDFLFKTMAVVLPRIRDFVGLSNKSFDNQGNYSLGLQTYSVFPEIHPDNATSAMGMQITIDGSTTVVEDMKQMMQNIGFVFAKK